MQALTLFLVITVSVVVAIVVSWQAQVRAQKRREDWGRWAAQSGYRFSATDPFSIPYVYPFPLFRLGRGRTAENVVRGQYRGRGFICFDYRYTTGSGKSTTRHLLTCLLLESQTAFPALLVRPESALDRLGHVFGLDDLQVRSGEFNRRYYVKCADGAFATEVLSGAVVDFLLRQTPGPVIEALEHAVLLHGPQSAVPLPLPAGVQALMNTGNDLLDLLPPAQPDRPQATPAA